VYPVVKAAVFGATGYGGIELIRLLAGHPDVELAYLASTSAAGNLVSEVFPHLAGCVDLALQAPSIDEATERADVAFFCLQPGEATAMIRAALDAGLPVLDFSADFRLKDLAAYEGFYGAHKAADLIPRAVYGLPELHREEIRATDLVAVPGCYPTGAVLALAPLVKNEMVSLESLTIDAKSGVSGAGRSKMTLTTHFSERNESMTAYGLPAHRHRPEIEQELGLLAGTDLTVCFVPHLIPITRGILTTAYADLIEGASGEALTELYRDFYAGEPFVRVMPAGQIPTTKQVWGSNFCDIGVAVDERNWRAVVVSAIDNLVKGLAGGAVQCMNLMCGLDETAGLQAPGMWP
jgi:N-acetyl-gamma-glutamyl-phosphate reductase